MMDPFKFTWKMCKYASLWYVFQKYGKQNNGASFINSSDLKKYVNSHNKGLLVDGVNKRLSVKDSFTHLLLIAKTGRGKTSKYVIPNILDKANQNCSFIINDPSNDIYSKTSEILKKNGFDIIVVDPENSRYTSRFNPISYVRDFVDIDTLSELLVSSGLPNERDIWSSAAKRIISIILRCLVNAPEEYRTLANLHRLTGYISSDPENRDPLTRFVAMYCRKDRYDDDSLKHDYMAFWNQNSEGIDSISLTVQTALRQFSNPQIRDLFGRDDIDFTRLRERKTAIFIITPAEKAKQFAFVTSILFNSFITSIMRLETFNKRKHLPIYVLYDELGHSRIPELGTVLNLIRAYGVSISGVLQSVSQIKANYGVEHDVIREAFNNYVVLSGADKQTCDYMSDLIGFTRQKVARRAEFNGGFYHEERHIKLINPDEIRALPEDQALCIFGDSQPARMTVQPYFERFAWRWKLDKVGVYVPPKKDDFQDYNVRDLLSS